MRSGSESFNRDYHETTVSGYRKDKIDEGMVYMADELKEAITLDSAEDVQRASAEMRVAMEELNVTFRTLKNMRQVIERETAESVKVARSMRMTVVSEVSTANSAFADVRKFLLSNQHPEEIARLRDFVELCERLEKLKASGFLDSIADTILRLA